MGLSLANVGFVKFNAAFPILLGATHISLKAFTSDAFVSNLATGFVPVSQDKIPFFVVACLPVIAYVCSIGAIMGLTIYSKTGYESQNSRIQKEPGNLAKAGVPKWISYLQSAQLNTWEACIYAIGSVFVSSSLSFPKDLAAKLCTFFLICRIVYPVFYVLDLDLFRTFAWFAGYYAMLLLAFGALYPGTIVPLLQ
eukprot:g2929.t1